MWAKIKKYAAIIIGTIGAVIAVIFSILFNRQKAMTERLLKEQEQMKRDIATKEIEIKNKEYDLYELKLKNGYNQDVDKLQKEIEEKKRLLTVDKTELEKYTRDVIGTSTGPGSITPQ